MDRDFLCTHSISALTTFLLRCVLKLPSHVTSYMKMLILCVSQNSSGKFDFDRHICTQGQTGKADASSLVTRAPCSIPATLHLHSRAMTSSTSAMAVDKPAKIDVDEYLTAALSSSPQELHPFFESFRNLYQRK